ncbi:site-2 protease family protein [Candidatus Saccharibacteria bacterium]|jgi:regulator of sigma E protease|nr:site-2 protease family protein [Candidatus Saccharibacteria bacterium]
MELILGIFAGIIILTVLVVLHELGHAIVAKRNGVTVEEFGIGFPPKAWGKKVKNSFLGKDVVYSVNWLPLGGFVKLQGEHDQDDGKKGDFGAASFWVKTKILLAGVLINWLTAAVLLTVLALFGVPKIVDNQFVVASDNITSRETPVLNYIESGSPADKSGLKTGDKVSRVAGKPLEFAEQLSQLTSANKGKKIVIDYERDGTSKTAEVTLRDDNSDQKGYLGASVFQRASYRATWSAPIVGIGLTGQLSWLTLQGVGDMATNFFGGLAQKLNPDQTAQKAADEKIAKAGDNVAGPVGLLGVILPSLISQGAQYMILITAVISLSLAVLNTLPIPGLDGGRWFLIALFRALNKPLKKETEERIVGMGMLFLMGLIVLITIADVGKVIK